MQKLLSLMLCMSILFTSVTSAWSGVGRGIGRVPAGLRKGLPEAVLKKVTRSTYARLALANSASFRAAIKTGSFAGLARKTLSRNDPKFPEALLQDFLPLTLVPQAVSEQEVQEAADWFEENLTLHAQYVLVRTPESSLKSFLTVYCGKKEAAICLQAHDIMAQAGALAFVGKREQASVLLDFYKYARGTLFEKAAILIAARGLLQMEAYEEFDELLSQVGRNSILTGVILYCKKHNLPVQLPYTLQYIRTPQGVRIPKADEDMASFLAKPFYPNRLHADPSLEATETWFSLVEMRKTPITEPKTTPAVKADAPQGRPAFYSLKPIQPAQIAKGTVSAPVLIPIEPFEFKEINPTNEQPVVTQKEKTELNTQPVLAAQPAAAGPDVPAASARRSSAGVVYGGIPIFPMVDGLKQAFNWMRKNWAKKAKKADTVNKAAEEPGLHVNNGSAVFQEAEVPAAEITDVEDVVGAQSQTVSVGIDNIKLSVEDQNGQEHILPNVSVTVSAALQAISSMYNRVVLNNRYIFQLRDHDVAPKTPDHFLFALVPEARAIRALIQGANKLNLPHFLRIKIQRTGSPKSSVTVPVVDTKLNKTSLVAEVDTSLLPGIKNPQQGAVLFNGKTLMFRAESGKLLALENGVIRLPKGESKYWSQILQMYPKTRFHLAVLPTDKKMVPLTTLLSTVLIGLGKVISPAVEAHTDLNDEQATQLMFFINNVLPSLIPFISPLLKRYGDVAVLRMGVLSFVLGGFIPVLSGLYGQIDGIMTPYQLAGFIISSACIALGTGITRLVQNPLISANLGIVPEKKAAAKTQKSAQNKAAGDQPTVYNTQYLVQRMKDVLTKKSTQTLRDVFYYQKGAMFKNLGTMLFLIFPMAVNLVAQWLGYDFAVDFSASYVPYSVYSLYVLYKIYTTHYKDVVPRNLTVLTNRLQDLQNSTAVDIAKINPNELTANHPGLMKAAEKLKVAIDMLVPVQARQQNAKMKDLTLQREAEVAEELENLLRLSPQWTAPQAENARVSLQKAFDVLSGRDMKWYKRWGKAIVMKGMPPALAAMTLATFAELGISNGLAFTARSLFSDLTMATGVSAGIYLFMFFWRMVGSLLMQRGISGGSIYAICSAAGVLGAGLMAQAKYTGDVGMLVTGAILSCFGISNFFSQMYDYMIKLHPDHKRTVSLLITCTMPFAAIPASMLRADWFKALGDGLDMVACTMALAASVVLTPKMLSNSSFVEFVKYEWKKLMAKLRGGSNGDTLPPAQPAAAQ